VQVLLVLLALEVGVGAIPHARADMAFPDLPQALGARFFGTLLLIPAMLMAGRFVGPARRSAAFTDL
jgi:hypothetical protein